MRNWEITGLIATLIIVISLPFYTVRQLGNHDISKEPQQPGFIGSNTCAKCHKKEFEEWQQSHHAKAMATASEETVLADFDNTTFIKKGIVSRFYKKNGRFFVHTQGPKGEMGDFEITHTFGWYPLQQYLVPFPGGRMQTLPIAWDVKTQKWFHLYPDLDLDPEEWIYWTNQGQNWNSMCADCHSTKLQKNYDIAADNYSTEWAEISVGCEACHGPGSQHLSWAELPEMARTDDSGLIVQTSNITNNQQVDLCAPCHSRRSMLGDYTHLQQDLLDTEAPRLLEEGLYHPDGQILDEVYVYGSFVQSKMYHNGVRCSDCHNVHTIKLHQEGNDLCLQCHQATVYDSKEHHFHKYDGEKGEAIKSADGQILFQIGSGTLCVQCHMPGKVYMGNDYRPDHSIRIPRPDLSVEIGTPNSCNRCHIDKTSEWSAEYTRKWYGIKKKSHYGTTFSAARRGEPTAKTDLIHIVSDNLAPIIVRATALSLLNVYQGEEVTAIFRKALENDAPLIRRTAISYLPHLSLQKRIRLVGPLLSDPIKGVRGEAAMALAIVPANQLDERFRKPFEEALKEFKQILFYSADFAAARLNLGVLANSSGQTDKAELQFLKAIAIDRDFYISRANLAVLYSQQGKNDLAEKQLRQALVLNPELYDVHYSLGLLLAENKQYKEALDHLEKAAAGMPNNSRVNYNYGQLLIFMKQYDRAEKALQKAVTLEPENMSYLTAVAKFYLSQQKYARAEIIAEQMRRIAPDNPIGDQLIEFIQNRNQFK